MQVPHVKPKKDKCTGKGHKIGQWNGDVDTYDRRLLTEKVEGVVDVGSKRGVRPEQVDMVLMTRVCHPCGGNYVSASLPTDLATVRSVPEVLL
jgi:hypothetical protein